MRRRFVRAHGALVGTAALVPGALLALTLHRGWSSYWADAHGVGSGAPSPAIIVGRYLLVAAPTLLLVVDGRPRLALVPATLALLVALAGEGTVLAPRPSLPLSTPDLWLPPNVPVVALELALAVAPAWLASFIGARMAFSAPSAVPRAIARAHHPKHALDQRT